MRGLQNYQAEQPSQTGGLQGMVSPQNLALLLGAYKDYQAKNSPSGYGDMGTSYGANPSGGTGFGLNQPLVSGGLAASSNPAPYTPPMSNLQQAFQSNAIQSSPYSNLIGLISKYRS